MRCFEKMSVIKISIFSMLVVGCVFLIAVLSFSITEEKIVKFECSPEFWRDNLQLWKVVGVNYNDSFDETFSKDYFEPDITLQQAISKDGVGMEHLARIGTTAYLNAMADPMDDEQSVRTAVRLGYVHQIDQFVENCKTIEKIVPTTSLLFG